MASSRLCAVVDCDKPVHGRGHCHSHYLRLTKYGDPLAGKAFYGSLLPWLRAHAEHEGRDCLVWPFARDRHGYGQVTDAGRKTKAHRVMCRLAYGEPPSPRHEAAHSCGNGAGGCVHPRHLRWATPVENAADKIGHGTENRGQRHGMSKLTAEDIRAIRSLAGKKTLLAIGALFGISQSHASEIINRHSWAWLD